MSFPNCFIVPQRYILIMMCCWSLVISTTMSGNIKIIIQAITFPLKNNNVIGNPCIRYEVREKSEYIITYSDVPKYSWNKITQNYMLITFFWGQLITNLPSGIFSDRYGGKWVLAFGMLFSGLISLLTPLTIIHFGSNGLILMRFILGCCNGCITPAIHSLISQWVPLAERTRSGVIIYSGINIGYQFFFIMHFVFKKNFSTLYQIHYICGFFAIIWFIIFVLVCYNDPISHPFIHTTEIEYLEFELYDLSIDKKNLKIPWDEILTSTPMTAYYIGSFAHSWGINLLIITLPDYYISILRYTIEETLTRQTISYTFMIFAIIIPGFISDCMIAGKIMSLTYTRKVWTSVAFLVPALFLIFGSLADCNAQLANVFFSICMAFYGPWYAGLNLNGLDLAPNYSGTINGIGNCIRAVTAFLLPLITNKVVESKSISNWVDLFWGTFFILCITSAYIGVAASGRVQQWNDMDYDKRQRKHKSLFV